jgi:hypothetical protein
MSENLQRMGRPLMVILAAPTFAWNRRTSQRTTRSDAWIEARDPSLGEAKAGILIGYRNEAELREVLGPDAVRGRKTDKVP